ncbi:MAG: hypothetical protein H6R21_2027 [Proteobacteria bacterium]|nr:hypothetical protein [Pseudomonadota bacterium]
MPWSIDRYPASMKNLPPRVRLHAIAIANALLDEGYDEGRCIRIAIARAKQRARTATVDRGQDRRSRR